MDTGVMQTSIPAPMLRPMQHLNTMMFQAMELAKLLVAQVNIYPRSNGALLSLISRLKYGTYCLFDILGSMTCVSGYCKNRISKSIYKSKYEVESLCRNNANCLAYDYSEDFGYGYLCGSTLKEEYDKYVICSKGRNTIVFS